MKIYEVLHDGNKDYHYRELYSSHTSISFPSSNNSTSEMETNEADVDGVDKKERKDKTKFKNCSYKCQFCEKSFPRLGYLKKHEQSHEDYMPFKCPVCLRLFKHKRSRDRHLKLHTGDRRYKCLYCESAFSRSDHLKIHMKTHDSKKAFQCSFCNRGYNTAAALTSHMQNHKKQLENRGRNDSPFNFSLKSSESSSTSMMDKKRFSDLISPKSFKSEGHSELRSLIRCFYCTKSNFVSLDQLNIHINIMHSHKISKDKRNEIDKEQNELSPLHSCEFCLMKFTSSDKLLKHIKAIHDEKNGEKVSVNSELCSLDMRIDNGNKFDNDDEQPTDLSQRFSKKIKIENSSVSKAFKPPVKSPISSEVFLCNQCNASLPNFELFRLHLKSHLEENYKIRSNDHHFEMNNAFYHTQKKFICPQCRDVVFDNRFEYDQHVEKHYTEFLCRECDDSFTKNEDLQNHLIESHVCFKCTLCSESLESIMSLKLHFASRHSHKRCSACHEDFSSDREFMSHIHSKHSSSDLIHCIFCRVTCSSELEMHFHFLSAHVKQFRCPACSESFHVEFLLDRHLQTHHSINDPQLSAKYAAEKEMALSHLNLQNYHPSLIDSNYKGKFLMNNEPKQSDNSLMSGLHSNIFALNSISNQYTKGIDLASLHESLNRAQSTLEESQNVRVKQLFSMNNNGEKSFNDTQNVAKSQNALNITNLANDRNNNKNATNKDKTDATSHYKEFEPTTDKSGQSLHTSSKSGVSLKCAYCEERDDFKSRTELENHMKIQHNIAAKHKCSICDEVLPSPAVLAEHKLQHCKVISGKCFHCSESINDVNDFKQHIQNHNMKNKTALEFPIHCICCHQLLASDFEMNLHAKFHTNSANTINVNDDRTCALCLNIMEQANIKKICNSCMTKHNFSLNSVPKNQLQLCNLCKKNIEIEKFQDHLIEHEMDNGTIACAICSSIFTSIIGLKDHIREHNLIASDLKEVCSKCNSRFLYRSELSHHVHEHELMENQGNVVKNEESDDEEVNKIKEEDEDDYIEIEKVVENPT
ncbi:CLUMA_CG001843, isoform A [Clunio marinus]|uniref:CLUMA_CG001843, isoform A n=1 Tax=Clunio marinus TaxID=568069 RepID=A0A1J1HKK3_9DIPT|nr:CLUMA_CG001843, isoform A [Clunio marinus]